MKNIKDLGEKEVKAKLLFDKMLEENDECTSTEMMIKFAEIQVKEEIQDILKEWTEGKFQKGLNVIIRERL